MSDDDHSPDREQDPPDGEQDRSPGTGVLGVLRQVVDALVDAERTGKSDVLGGGQRSGGTVSVEYGFSGRLGGLADESGTAANDPDSRPTRNARSTGRSTHSTDRRTRSTGDDEYLVDVREDDGEIVVVADVAGVDVDDITVGLADERTTLVVGIGDGPLGRMDLPWRAADAVPRHHHGVLEIRLVPEEDDR